MSIAQWRHQRQEDLATSKFGWLEHNFLSCWLSLSMDLFCTGKKYQSRTWKIKRRLGQNKSWIKRSSVLILQHWSSVLSALLCLQYPIGLEIHYNCSIRWIGEILNTNNQNTIVIFWIFRSKLNGYFDFFWKKILKSLFIYENSAF